MLFYILLGPKDACASVSDCNKSGASGELCPAGKCICGSTPCATGEFCKKADDCSMYLKSNNPNKIINLKLKRI